ncbi:MAG: Mur ligase family protein [Acidobacteriota bacterium]
MKVFLSGIAGTGMSSLAGLFKEAGFDVSGSDTAFYPPVGPMLKSAGITTFEGFSASNIPQDVDFCVIGNIISRGNPEAEFILNNKIKFYSMAAALKEFFIKDSISIVASGTHGKTTVSSFLAYLFSLWGADPGYFIGGKPVDLGSNYSTGKGKYFISEGDEYETAFFDRSSKFLKYFPDILIISSLEYDHLDFFRTETDYLHAFRNLVNQVPSGGTIIFNSDFSMAEDTLEGSISPRISYGKRDCDYTVGDIQPDPEGINFSLKSKDAELVFRTPLHGEYNVLNLSAGIIAGIHSGIPVSVIKDAVKGFNGVERRLRKIGTKDNSVLYEDFAHHPTSIREVLKSLKTLYPGKILTAFFEPASWSLKNKYFEDRLLESLSIADEVLIKAPVRMGKIPESKRINIEAIAEKLNSTGKKCDLTEKISDFETFLKNISHKDNRTIVILSNGSFDSLPSFAGELFR